METCYLPIDMQDYLSWFQTRIPSFKFRMTPELVRTPKPAMMLRIEAKPYVLEILKSLV